MTYWEVRLYHLIWTKLEKKKLLNAVEENDRCHH
jgi:hypothetical protein